MTRLSRRGFLAASSAAALPLILPYPARAATEVQQLFATTRVLDIAGRAVKVRGLLDAQGRSGLVIDPGKAFRVDLINAGEVETTIHWHGQHPPNAQDGVTDLPQPSLKPGETRSFDFASRPGTHWMHSHIPVQEMELLAAPLIVRSAGDLAADRQEVTILLHDLSFRPAADVLAEITSGASMAAMGHDMAGHGQATDQAMSGMSQGGTQPGGKAMGAMGAMGAMDLNDFAFDAYLANDRTLDDPELVAVETGGRVLLRIINGAAATVFWIDTGTLPGRVLATDGNAVVPVSGSRFGLAMGQRLDIEVTIPAAGGAFPVLALREGGPERTGIILATPGAAVAKLPVLAAAAHPAFSGDLTQEAAFRAMEPLLDRPTDRSDILILAGSMTPYLWTIDGKGWGNHRPIVARAGERVVVSFHNMSMMAHPMHLHGHVFQVIALNGQAVKGALRDTVHLPPMSMVSVALDAGEAARWMLHCHHMPHLATGMMTELAISA